MSCSCGDNYDLYGENRLEKHDGIKTNDDNKNIENIKENFCISCVGMGVGIAGIGTTIAKSFTNKKHKKIKKILKYTGISLLILSCIIIIIGITLKK